MSDPAQEKKPEAERPEDAEDEVGTPGESPEEAKKRAERNRKKREAKKRQKERAHAANSVEAAVAACGARPKEEPAPELRAKLLEVVQKNEQGLTVAPGTADRHSFWSTQPVPALGAHISAEFNYPIEPDKKPEEVSKDPVPLPEGYYFCDCDVANEAILKEVYTLLNENYVEDDDNMFRFDYSPEFLRWALTPPGAYKSWIVGMRSHKTNELMGFITGIPVNIRVYDRVVRQTEINFLCVHKTLRALRLAPTLIQEVTRRVHLQGMFQAVYTAGVVLPNPVASCRYLHRSLNPKKLIEVGFSSMGQRMTMSRTIKLYKLPDKPETPGLRPMQHKDARAVLKLLHEGLAKFKLVPVYTEEEVCHWFLPRNNVVYSYVVENKDKVITGFTSFYCLPSTIIGNQKYKTLKAAYSYYNFNAAGTVEALMKDALILARDADFDVFNCLDLMDNESFLRDLHFGQGDGKLQYYLFNWACPELQPKEVGLVLL
eukprot:m51a1_g11386 putative glycylpeptide n-tetradecanoyltransferase 1 (487) ;mRNA; r:10607-12842